ncbi:MAG: dTDP-4-dehydrorhamnose reductase [Candidatus Riflebacteria bacterium]|nr:dTDP-4-dehydrorhamnose reductase [Candidatus Riflebacteria bacterium]
MAQQRRILLTGSGGQLGCQLQINCPDEFELLARSHSELDITDADSCRKTLQKVRPDWVINAAAYTDVERAETEPEQAMRINAQGARNLAQAALAIGARLLHISTDFVFDGRLRRPYRPADTPNPMSSYGRSKLAGELVIREAFGADALILRTSWLYGPTGRNFLTTIMCLLREQPVLRIVADQIGTPTSVLSLSGAIYAAIKADVRGIYHWSDAGETSWYDFACAIQHEAMQIGLLIQPRIIEPISTADFPSKAHRPEWSVLDKSSFTAVTSFDPRPWQQELPLVMEKLNLIQPVANFTR